MGSGSASGLSANAAGAKEIQLSANALQTYLGITIDAKGQITSISKEAFSVFTHNTSVALLSSAQFDPTKNALIGQQIDNFKKEQFSFYVAGRAVADTTYGGQSLAPDKREVPDSVEAMASAMQMDAAKYSIVSQYNQALKLNANNTANFGQAGFTNIEAMFGATLKITSSSSAFGVSVGDTFHATLNEGFLIGYGYVRGFYELRNILVEMWEAKSQNLRQAITISGKTINITYNAATTSFSFDGTPINVDTTYPSGFHYGALLSRHDDLPTVSYADWDISALSSFSLGYSSGLINSTQAGAGTVVSDGTKVANYRIAYSGIDSGSTITVAGDDTYYFSAGAAAAAGNQIDLKTVVGLPGITSFAQLQSDEVGTKLYYRYWKIDAFAYLDANNYNALPVGQQFELIYTTGATQLDVRSRRCRGHGQAGCGQKSGARRQRDANDVRDQPGGTEGWPLVHRGLRHYVCVHRQN
jgi:hypothetical protein